MVKLEEQSSINQYESPVLYQWDTAVRKSYNMYQRLIDAKTYQLQRVQRYLLSLKYPYRYNYDLITLNLLKKKQRVGEVNKQEMEIYKQINPSISKQFHKVFGASLFKLIPLNGVIVGTGLLAFGALFNFTVPARCMHFFLPIVIDHWFNLRNPKAQVATSQFLDWVYLYRKGKVFNQRYNKMFSGKQIKQVLQAHGNLQKQGDQFVQHAL